MSHPAGRSPLNKAFRSPLVQQLVAQSLANVNRNRSFDMIDDDGIYDGSQPLSFSTSLSSNRHNHEESSQQAAPSSSCISPVPQYTVSSILRSRHKNPNLSSPLASSRTNTLDGRQVAIDGPDELQQEIQALNVFSDGYSSNSRYGSKYNGVMSSSSQLRPGIFQMAPFPTLQREADDSRCMCRRQCSSLSATDSEFEETIPSGYSSEEASLFQNILMTRRTTSNYQPLDDINNEEQLKKMKEAVKRAVACAVQAPNHKRTEPYTFKAMFLGSEKREIMLNLLERHTSQKARGDDQVGLRKKEKWSKVPAFIVALCSGQPVQCDEEWAKGDRSEDDRRNLEEMPFIAPSSLRQVEDYASTCAAIENMLLSLHAEGYGTKWSTGSLTRTWSFRQLVGAEPDELIVGLVFVGIPKIFSRRSSTKSSSMSAGGRRLRRNFNGDLFRNI